MQPAAGDKILGLCQKYWNQLSWERGLSLCKTLTTFLPSKHNFVGIVHFEQFLKNDRLWKRNDLLERKAGLQVSKQNIRLEAYVFNSNTKPLNMGEIYIPYINVFLLLYKTVQVMFCFEQIYVSLNLNLIFVLFVFSQTLYTKDEPKYFSDKL